LVTGSAAAGTAIFLGMLLIIVKPYNSEVVRPHNFEVVRPYNLNLRI
jgi:hypothetical protein